MRLRPRTSDVPALDVEELTVRRAIVCDAAGVEPYGHFERLAAELGVSADELRAWLHARGSYGLLVERG